MTQLVSTLILGFLLGIKHAFDTDHVIAVSTMAYEYKHPFKTGLIGAFWGMGHTTTLFLVGIVILLFKIRIPENISLTFESLVGFMLILLGIRTLLHYPIPLHIHSHKHRQEIHIHPHCHKNTTHLHHHHRSFLIGTIHGLAGSGALMILVLSTIHSTIQGIYYILTFGIGSIAGMTIISIILGLPFIYSTKKFPTLEKYLNLGTGILSIIFGLYLVYQIVFMEDLLGKLFL